MGEMGEMGGEERERERERERDDCNLILSPVGRRVTLVNTFPRPPHSLCLCTDSAHNLFFCPLNFSFKYFMKVLLILSAMCLICLSLSPVSIDLVIFFDKVKLNLINFILLLFSFNKLKVKHFNLNNLPVQKGYVISLV